MASIFNAWSFLEVFEHWEKCTPYDELDTRYYSKETGNICSLLSADAIFWLVCVLIFYALILGIIVVKIFLLFV